VYRYLPPKVPTKTVVHVAQPSAATTRLLNEKPASERSPCSSATIAVEKSLDASDREPADCDNARRFSESRQAPIMTTLPPQPMLTTTQDYPPRDTVLPSESTSTPSGSLQPTSSDRSHAEEETLAHIETTESQSEHERRQKAARSVGRTTTSHAIAASSQGKRRMPVNTNDFANR
jgi:hypothetical protein